MNSSGRTFVGFGFGPIQGGLFLLEACRSGNFSRLAVAEVDADLVDAVHRGGNRYTVNVAHADRIERISVEGVELYNPTDSGQRRRLIDAVAEAAEMATALPSVSSYDVGGPTSVAAVIGEGLVRRQRSVPTVLYAAENHNHAAERLAEAVGRHCPSDARARLQTLNTVIGKMSGLIDDSDTIARLGLATLAPGLSRAILVEAFNQILVSRAVEPARRGIEVFIEKSDLLPFEEAKLYGHNAVHALIGYLAERKGLTTMADATADAWIMSVARKAFIDESGAALIRRHADLADELFTPEGYRAYADDLLERMACPFLNDRVRRVTRDHVRKLGYSDRLFGTMRLALEADLQPTNLALGSGAAVLSLIARPDELDAPLQSLPRSAAELTKRSLADLLLEIWGQDAGAHAKALIDLTWRALQTLAGPQRKPDD